MALSKHTKTIRLFYLASCVLNWFVACVAIGAGIWTFVHYKLIMYSPNIECIILNIGNTADEISALHAHGYMFITAGITLSLVTFAGFYGALKRKIVFIGVSLGVFFVVLALLFAVGVWLSAKTWSGKLTHNSDSITMLTTSVVRYDSDDRNFMEHFQMMCECCGVNTGIQDYSEKVRLDIGDDVLCKPEFHNTPCIQKIHFYDNVKILFGLAFGAASILFISIALCICLLCSMCDRNEEMN